MISKIKKIFEYIEYRILVHKHRKQYELLKHVCKYPNEGPSDEFKMEVLNIYNHLRLLNSKMPKSIIIESFKEELLK